MFTGIIEQIGTIKSVQPGIKSSVLTIQFGELFQDVRLGDSIAVNGVCLTVKALGKGWFQADVMAESLRRSSLLELKAGSIVNLERAMPADGRFGGHIVSGHIDGIGKIVKVEAEDNAVWFTIQAENKLLRYIVEKGSVAIDGISLTVTGVTDSSFQVSVIPHTIKNTVLSQRNVGDSVNLECDVIGKYVERLLQERSEKESQTRISMDLLNRNGFI